LDGSIASLTNPISAKVVAYTYSGAARALSAVTSSLSLNYVTAATYAPTGAVATMVNGNAAGFAGITSTNSYNKRLQPVTLSAANPSQTILSLGYNFHLGSGDNGNVFQIVNNRDNNRTQNFTYDVFNRISQANTTGPNWGETFTTDPWGNLTNRGPVSGKTNYENFNASPASPQNRLPGFGYDAAGNMTSNGSATYTYDGENRLLTTAGLTYTYDGDGKRVRKSSGPLYWTGTGSDPLNESDLTGTFQKEYIFFNGKRVARRDADGSVHYYFSDHLGSASIITNATGTMPPQEESDYYPYGGEIVVTNGDPNPYKFTSKERDTESGLDMFGARYYGSSLGRFMTPDWATKPTNVPYAHFGNPQTLNLYSYVQNNPTTMGDPDGHCGEDLCIVEGGAAIYVGGAALLAGTAAVLSTPAGQRSLSTFTSAAGQSISNSISSINSFFSKDTATSATPGTQTGTQAGSQPKDVYIDPSKYPASAGHAADAQAAGHPDVLTVDRPGASDRRADATAGHATQPGTDRDEYPPAVTREGGAGASVQNIPSSDNRGSGASIGNQIRDVPNGGQIRVIPEKKPDSN